MKKTTLFIAFIVLFATLSSCSENKNTQPEYVPEFTLGETSDSQYTNSFLGIGFELNDSWKFSDPNKYDDTDYVSCMYAKFDMECVEILCYKDSDGFYTSAEDFANFNKKTLSDIGWEQGKVYQKEFCNQEYTCLDLKLYRDNGEFTAYRSYYRRIGNYIAIITIISVMSTPAQVESMFYQLT